MAALDRDLRKQLEKNVIAARDEAEIAARAALEALAVHHHEAYAHMLPAQRALRNRLRAHARQLGDRLDERRGTQAIDHLVQECAYEHWHRMLFARFLAENDLLVEPESGMAISLDECGELARDQQVDRWELASRFAQRMLPQIFRLDDPVLHVPLSVEHRGKLESLLDELPARTFQAHDSLGWVYQYWQSRRKDEINASGKKIGADELPPVTQLFTEHYMVRFLLHNTIGAWHAGKVLSADPEIARAAKAEEEVRRACALLDYEWEYLRFVRENDGTGPWRPAAGTFQGWPGTARQITVLDPCCGSGHFLVAAFAYLVRLRIEEEGLSRADAARAVLAENLHGLEVDPRCTQIAAFALALAAWKFIGEVVALPPINIACSGLSTGAGVSEWLKLAGPDQRTRAGLEQLHQLFAQAPLLGSLINPRTVGSNLLVAGFDLLQPLLDKVLGRETHDDGVHEIAVTAQGAATAAKLLARQFTLVATNVPYLGSGKQTEALKTYCAHAHKRAKADLATAFLQRCEEFCSRPGSLAVVTPQNWWFLRSYRELRRDLLGTRTLKVIVTLGEEAWQTFKDRGPVAALMIIDNDPPHQNSTMGAIDALPKRTIEEKISEMSHGDIRLIPQTAQFENPDHRIIVGEPISGPLLQNYASCVAGVLNGDSPKFQRFFWEFPACPQEWVFQQSTVERTSPFAGRELVISFDEHNGHLREDAVVRRERLHNSDQRGNGVWGKWGVAVSQMRSLPVTLYSGEKFDSNVAVICPRDETVLPAIWAFCSSAVFAGEVRRVDKKVNVTNASLGKIPFDLAYWRSVATEKYPDGIPKPHSDDPTQWLFSGHPIGTTQVMHVAVLRLLGYRWPRQTGSRFAGCTPFGPDGLESHAATEGLVCFSSLKGEAPASERIMALLSAAFRSERSSVRVADLLAAAGSRTRDLNEWLREEFFAQQCVLFHHRPLIWHIWDGRRDGFHALINCHQLAGSEGKGRKLLETLTYSYLGDWITRQRTAVKEGEAGAEARLAASLELQQELAKIIEGEPPYDIFVRWKPLQQQPIGWEPDINDGVRINIRPFMSATLSGGRAGAGVLRWKPNIKWEKDRGKEPVRPQDQYPWFWNGDTYTGQRRNDVHLSNAQKCAARERLAGRKEQRA